MSAPADNSIGPGRRGAGDHAPAIIVPPQLRRADLRFVLVRAGSKRALEAGWPTVANYAHDHLALAGHLARGHPYGLFPAPGSRVVVVDADHLDRLRALGALDGLPATFAVATGSSAPGHPKAHLYYALDGEPLAGKRAFFDRDGSHLGEVFAQHPAGGKGFVIGPGSRHAVTNRPYRIEHDIPIASLSREAWDRFAAGVRWRERPNRPAPAPAISAAGGSLADRLDLTVDRVWPVPAGARRSGEWLRFAHPVHGSANGDNLAVHRSGRAWYCHRCASSGDALAALAVDAGVIACRDAGPGCLADPARMENVVRAARARGLAVDDALRARRAARLPPPYGSLDVAAIRARVMAPFRGAAE